MTCPKHGSIANRACRRCRKSVAKAFAGKILRLGSRSSEQYAALLASARASTPWFDDATSAKWLRFPKTGPAFAVHRVHALSMQLAARHAAPVRVDTVVPRAMRTAFMAYAGTPASGLTLIRATDAAGASTTMVRSATEHNAYDKPSLLAALKVAGGRGIARSVIAAEYEAAYTDLEQLAPEHVYVTARHAWHRSVAVPRVPGLLERARSLKLVCI